MHWHFVTRVLAFWFLVLSYAQVVRGDVNSSQACTSIVATLGQSTVQSSGVEYDAAAHGAWNLFNTDFEPTCIVFPRNASHVQTAMKAIFEAESDYAVQAGGHSTMKGWNNVQDGVLIDFSHMNTTFYDVAKDTITLEPGVHWDDAVSILQAQGVAPVGGRQGDVGMGLLLGGGLSFLSPAHGFAADSFKELDVVLVSGQLVTATVDNQYADLFRALKGGANRFGIVTRYEVFPVHTGTKNDKTYFGGTIIYPASSIEAVLNATAHYVQSVQDPKAVLLTSLVNTVIPGAVLPIIAVNLFYIGPELPTSIFGEFLAINSTEQILSPLSYFDVAGTLGTGADRGNGVLFGASALVGDESLYLDAFNHIANFTTTFQSELNITVLAFTPVLGPQIQAGRARGGNAIDPPDGGYAAVQIQKQFLPGVLTISPEVEDGVQLLFEQIPRSPAKPLFMNECDAKQNVFETYGDYEVLKQTYAKYDPTRFNVRHTNGPIGL
ncbi:FAD-binding domain-containing protein [Ramaria rubella]|nr:FAD-binding domain-containing protein [Ramaria rubella]